MAAEISLLHTIFEVAIIQTILLSVLVGVALGRALRDK